MYLLNGIALKNMERHHVQIDRGFVYCSNVVRKINRWLQSVMKSNLVKIGKAATRLKKNPETAKPHCRKCKDLVKGSDEASQWLIAQFSIAYGTKNFTSFQICKEK